MSEKLLAPTFLFRFQADCPRCDLEWNDKVGFELPATARIPSFATLEGRKPFADLRVGWSPTGVWVTLRVEQRRTPIWCRATRWEDSDGLSLWVATRDVSQIHRATRHCHRFILLPQGSGGDLESPVAQMASVARAKELPKPLAPGTLRVRSEKRIDGYLLQAFIPAAALTGFDAQQQTQLGFFYAVHDREHGWQLFALTPEFPFDADPSLWGTLRLLPQHTPHGT